MPYTLEFLVKKTPSRRKWAARYVRITRLKLAHNRKGKPFAACQSYSTHDVLPGGYVVRRRVKTKYVTVITLLDRRHRCVISCSCPDFVFSGAEYVLNQRGSADIEYGNGDAPTTTNPGMKPLLCVAKNSLVITTRGAVPIQDVSPGDKVLTIKGYKPVVAAAQTGRHQPTLRFTTDTQRQLEVTPDHKVLTFNPEKGPVWKKAKYLSAGDWLLTKKAPPAPHYSKLDPLFQLLGIVVAETGELYGESLTKVERKVYRKLYRMVFGKAAPKQGTHLVLTREDEKYFDSLGVTRDSYRKRVPDIVWRASLEQKAAFVYGLIHGDGWVSPGGRAITIASVSKKFARQIQNLLLSFGVHSTLCTNECRPGFFQYLVRPTSAGCQILHATFGGYRKYEYTPRKYAALSQKENRFPPMEMDVLKRRVFTRYVGIKVGRDGDKLVPLADFLKETFGHSFDGLATAFRRNYDFVRFPGLGCRPKIGGKASDVAKLYASLRKLGAIPELTFLSAKRKKGVRNLIASIEDPAYIKAVRQFKLVSQESTVWEKIIAVTPSVSDVYDLQIDGCPNFTANGFLVHNCKHVIALYEKIKPKLEA